MKPPVLLLSFAASFAALTAAAIDPVFAVTPVLVAGLLLLLSTDYRERRRPLVCTGPACAKTAERLRLAA